MAKKTKQTPEPESDSELNIDQADVNKDSGVEAEKEMKVSKVKKEKEPKKTPKSKKEKVVDDLEDEVEIPSKKVKNLLPRKQILKVVHSLRQVMRG